MPFWEAESEVYTTVHLIAKSNSMFKPEIKAISGQKKKITIAAVFFKTSTLFYQLF